MEPEFRQEGLPGPSFLAPDNTTRRKRFPVGAKTGSCASPLGAATPAELSQPGLDLFLGRGLRLLRARSGRWRSETGREFSAFDGPGPGPLGGPADLAIGRHDRPLGGAPAEAPEMIFYRGVGGPRRTHEADGEPTSASGSAAWSAAVEVDRGRGASAIAPRTQQTHEPLFIMGVGERDVSHLADEVVSVNQIGHGRLRFRL